MLLSRRSRGGQTEAWVLQALESFRETRMRERPANDGKIASRHFHSHASDLLLICLHKVSVIASSSPRHLFPRTEELLVMPLAGRTFSCVMATLTIHLVSRWNITRCQCVQGREVR